MTRANNQHRRALEKIAASPNKFGFDNIVYVAIEPNLFDTSGRVVAQPDVVLTEKDGTTHIVEYKGNGNGAAKSRAEEQLTRASVWWGRYTKTSPEKIHTHLISGTDPKYQELFR